MPIGNHKFFLPLNLFLKFWTKCHMHSLCSACQKTSLTPCITACPQSVQNVKPGGVPIASFNLFISQIQFSFVSESMTPIATGYIQLCASTTQAMHKYLLNFSHKKVLSTAKYGLQPLRKPSTHGFRAKKHIKPIFFVNSVVIDHNKWTRTCFI